MQVDYFTIVSYNCKHFKDSGPKFEFMQQLLGECDVLLIQEHCLFKSQMHKLKYMNQTSEVVGKSSMDESDMLVGRPFGGVAIVYNDRLKGIIYEVECRNDRLTAICIQYNDTESALIINVYMPCDTRRYDDSYGVYMDILDEVEIIVKRM